MTEETGTVRTRVKVYELDAESQWVDKGTGHISIMFVEAKEALCIIVKSEDGAGLIMNSRIRQDFDTYSRQQDTLIVWSEPDGTDLALSFQEVPGCNDVWEAIMEAQKRMRADKHDIDQLPLSTDELLMTEDFKAEEFSLPLPELSKIEEIESTVMRACESVQGRHKLADYLLKTDFMDKFLALLEDCEDLEAREDIYILSNILRAFILLNDSGIYEYILKDNAFMSVIGLLEYDREYPQIKAGFRDYFREKAHFKQIVPIQDLDIVAKINQTYRVNFLKDVALARLLDEQTFSALTSIAFLNQAEIVTFIQSDPKFLDQLFSILSEENLSLKRRKDVVLFLHELSSIVKGMHPQGKSEFFRSLAQHGLFAIFEYTLGDQDTEIRIAVISILTNVLDGESPLVRSFCLAQSKQGQKPLSEILVDKFLTEPDSGLRSQLSDILRMLLDTFKLDATEGLVHQSSEAEEFLTLFYESGLPKLVSPILELDEGLLTDEQGNKRPLVIDREVSDTCFHICELLSFMVKNHQFRSKFFFMGDITKKLLLLLKSRDTYIRLAALRVFRACVGTKDEFYVRILLKNEVLAHVMETLRDTESRYNLLNSACLEFLEFLRKENVKQMVAHLASNFKSELETGQYATIFKGILTRHEQNTEPPAESKNLNDENDPTIAAQQKDAWSKMDQNEDAYFSNMDEEEDTVTGDTQDSTASPSTSVDIDLPDKFSGSSPALVNYPDDDDDEDEILVRPKKEKTIKLSISLGGLTSTKSKSPVTMESAKGLVGEKVESEKRATSPPSSPLEFVKSSLNSMQEATALEEQQTLKKQRTL